MFWKRKKTDSDMCYIESDDRRASYRVCPHDKLPVSISVDSYMVQIVDIGAGGVAFKNIDLKEGSLHIAVISLPGYNEVILANIYIISIDRNDICHCYYTEIGDEDVEAIHKYVLEVQKEEIRDKKADSDNTL